MNYTVRPAAVTPQLGADWQDSIWAQAETLEIQHFRPEGSDHRPRTFARLLHTADGIQGIFHVHDRYVRCRRIWTLGFFIPFALFEHYLGPLGAPASQVWRGNFFK